MCSSLHDSCLHGVITWSARTFRRFQLQASMSHSSTSCLLAPRARVLATQGVAADVDGVSVAVGSLRLLASNTDQALPADVLTADEGWRSQGMTVIWVAIAQRAAGAIVLSDQPRPEAADAVAMLQRQKLHCAMLTGGCFVGTCFCGLQARASPATGN